MCGQTRHTPLLPNDASPDIFLFQPGAGPALPGIIIAEAAPALLVWQSWAPRTPLLCSFVTEQGLSSVLHLAGAQQTSSLLRRGISPLHHHQLLSPAAAAAKAAESRSRPRSAGTSAPTVSLCGRRVRGHARASALAVERTGARRSIQGNAGAQAGFRAAAATQAACGGRSAAGHFMEHGFMGCGKSGIAGRGRPQRLKAD
jgi:hypothetical protein